MTAYNRRPLISNIHRFTLDDGPGIRTTVFLKGCPLSCIWCHNPESIKAGREIGFHLRSCIKCGDCGAACRDNAIDLNFSERVIRDRCTACGICADACPAKSLYTIGTYYPVDDLVKMLLNDRILYETSRGGVTFSGGEPMLYMDYVGETMKALKEEGVHIVIQTCGMFDLEEFIEKILPYTDLIYYDIKFIDDEEHRRRTGKGNPRILANFMELRKDRDVRIIPRIPLVPGITATEWNIRQIADFLMDAGCDAWELLPYNPGGISKRIAIGDDVPAILPRGMMGMEEEKMWKEAFNNRLNA